MTVNLWLLVGLIGQGLFFMRFIVQWIVSERRKTSVIPVQFWYWSIGGSLVLLFYAVHLRDPVFILGQSLGSIIYVRNLMLIGQQNAQRPS
jgi:lipid-A-disaccharide synthase-like uncharacterized protein